MMLVAICLVIPQRMRLSGAVTEIGRLKYNAALVRPEDVTNEEKEAIDTLMTKLPEDMTNKQRKRVKALLFRYRSIISTGKHDIERTNLVEHRTDTGEHRPIRQALRRHPF